jgi:hypothetical protein
MKGIGDAECADEVCSKSSQQNIPNGLSVWTKFRVRVLLLYSIPAPFAAHFRHHPGLHGVLVNMYDWKDFKTVFQPKPDFKHDPKHAEAVLRHREELGGTLFFDRIWGSLGLKQRE